MIRILPLAAAVLLAAHATVAQTWTKLATEGPSARRNAAAVYDPVSHRVVLFGGRGAGGDHNDVWALDLATETWGEITPDDDGPTPTARFTHNAVYDTSRHRALIWSGRILNAEGSTLLNDVWGFDLTTDRWQPLEPATEAPVARYGTAAVFDPVDGSLVTFAGFTTQGRFDDTWRFDPRTRDWRDASPPGGRPDERCLHTAAYDLRRHRMIIFGGQGRSPSLDDAWAYDLGGGAWVQLASAPETGGRRFPAAAYDPVDDRFLVFGGQAADDSKGGDLWALDLVNDAWSRLTTAGPEPRDGAVLVYVPGEARLLMFGGTGDSSNLADTWTLALRAPPTAVDEEATTTPSTSSLHAYPNPFNARVSIEVTASSGVRLDLYDALGRRVRSLGRVPAGTHRLTWDGTDDGGRPAASGVYAAVLRLGATRRTTRLVLLR